VIKITPYEILGLEGDFEYSDIKKSYKKLIRQYPPQSEPEMFAKIRDAYDSLTNEEYYLNSKEDELVYSLKKIDIDEKKIDSVKYLTTVFETPFDI